MFDWIREILNRSRVKFVVPSQLFEQVEERIVLAAHITDIQIENATSEVLAALRTSATPHGDFFRGGGATPLAATSTEKGKMAGAKHNSRLSL